MDNAGGLLRLRDKAFENPSKMQHGIHLRRRADVNQGNKRFGLGMVLGLAVGMILYRLIFG
jgi:hypothetical protein